MRRVTFAVLLAAPFAACATGGTSFGGGGLFPGDQEHEARAKASIQQRVAFDMDCQDVQMTRISDVTRLGQQMTTMSIGATGCGKKASYYVECVSNWGNITCNARLNSTTAQGGPSKSG